MGSGQLSSLQDFGPQFQTAGIVHVQDLYGGAPNRADALDARAFKREVVGPSVTPRMEDRRHLPSLRIDSREVRAFVQVAAVAG
jgi:hypothetical protein